MEKAAKEIPYLLEKKSLKIKEINSQIKKKYSEECEESTPCICGKRKSKFPEWKHQIGKTLWKLRIQNKIKYDKSTEYYSIFN